MTPKPMSRREFLASAAAATAGALIAAPASRRARRAWSWSAAASPGRRAARALKRADPRIAVTLVEANRTFTACPFSNLVIGGLRELAEPAVRLRQGRRRRHRGRRSRRRPASTAGTHGGAR